jgi:Ca-activated chloride channel homolog
MSGRGLRVWLFVSILSFPLFLSAASADGERPLSQQLRVWAEILDILATDREKNLFSGLQGDSERQMFFQQFWQARDPFPQTSRNELREEWESRFAEVARRWRGLSDDRARVFLLRGEPSSRFEAQCPSSSFEVWIYEPGFREKYRTVLFFLPGDSGQARLWRPGALPDVTALTTENCSNREKLTQETRWIRWTGKDQYAALVERALSRPRPREWVSTFRPVSIEAPDSAPPLEAQMEVEYAGLQWDKVVVRVLMLVSPTSLQTGLQTGMESSKGPEFSITGQVMRDGEPLETFLYRLNARAVVGGVPLVFERYLAPGKYRLRVRLEHLASGGVLVTERELAVPQMQRASVGQPAAPGPVPEVEPAVVQASLKAEPAPEPEQAPAAPAVAGVLAEADAVLSARRPGLRLLPPPGSLLIGHIRFPVRVEQAPDAPAAERIERVVFTLDGKPLLTRNNPPFDLALDLGTVPRPRKLRAEGIGGDGQVVARDEMLINAGAQDFRIRLLEPRPGRQYRQSVRVLAEVTPPPGASVERVELWFGEERIATLYQPPWSQPFILPQAGETGYLRAVAYLAGGGSSEDLVFINTPIEPDALDVHMVELYATVLDGQGRPLTGGLDPRSLIVLENGVRQQIRQVEEVGDTPVRVVTLIDSSASMAAQIGPTRQAAMEFLHSLLRPHDQAAVIAFNRAPQVTVPLTSDLGQLDEGLKGILAENDTALYDSLVYSLLYLTESSGQRAVLLLSDGLDRTSRLGFEQALEAARRTGIAVYAIGLGLEGGPKGEAAKRLHRLATVTGGRSYFAQDISELGGVYKEIEKELRAQYRIAYQSSHTGTDGAFRTVEVQVGKGGGMEARTISGYYP